MNALPTSPWPKAEDKDIEFMYPSQAEECLRAAAKLMKASWLYAPHDGDKIRADMVTIALDILDMVKQGMERYRQ